MEDMASEAAMAEGAESVQADASSACGDGAGRAVSETNVQEEGVDEPDVVKTDGELIHAACGGWLPLRHGWLGCGL
jgi:uncharacterized secreted protein with C-terminal beta-propeller domain